jgi:cytochrome b561
MNDNRLTTVRQLSPAPALKHALLTIVLHWSTVLAVVMAVAAIYLRDYSEARESRQMLLTVHRQLGLLVMIGVPLRILARYRLGFANHTAGMTELLRWAAAATHLALYAALIALPLIGLAATSAKGIQLQLLGLVPIPNFVAADPDVADTLVDLHMWGAWSLMGLIGMHALAALWHHFVRRDAVLAAMLPGWRVPVALDRRKSLSPVAYERRRASKPVAFERRRTLVSE